MQNDSGRIVIFDTTLRDGEQSPGATMNEDQKVMLAHRLARLRVDVIEAGFAASSPGDAAAIARIAREVGAQAASPIICSLARMQKQDIAAAADAIKSALRRRIHVFMATSPLHMEKKLNMAPAEVKEAIRAGVAYAKSLEYDIEFSCEDASRTELDFMCEAVTIAIQEGATTINIPDTVGYALPYDYAARIAYLRANVPGIEQCVISVHCHNDLGFAVANSLAGVTAGARQIECTINGIGERAGNAAMEEIVMAMRTRPDSFPGLITTIDATGFGAMSKMVSMATGIRVQANKAVVGANAFAHEAGIHQDGMIKDRNTYEIMEPEHVGWTGDSMVMGKHSGRRAFTQRLEALGFMTLNPGQIQLAFTRFKALCDAKKDVYDEDIFAIVEDICSPQGREDYELTGLRVITGLGFSPRVELKIRRGSTELETVFEEGDGPVDAIAAALQKLLEIEAEVLEFGIEGVTRGQGAQGRAVIRLRIEGRELRGHGTSTNILIGAATAYLVAVNRFLLTRDVAAFAVGGTS